MDKIMDRITFEKHGALFIEHLADEKNFSTHTQRAYRSDIHQASMFWAHLEESQQRKIDAQQALTLFVQGLYKKKLSPTSLVRKLSPLKSYERFLAQLQVPAFSLDVARPSITTPQITYLSSSQIQNLLEIKEKILIKKTQRPYRDKAIIRLLYTSGITCSELTHIKMSDIMWEEKMLLITNPKKEQRLVPLDETTLHSIKLYCNKERKKADSLKEYVFLNFKYQPLTTRPVQRICNVFSSFLEGAPAITPHLLRHSCAMHMLERGASSQEIQQRLGLSTSTTVERYISHRSPKAP